ncbi:MAG: CsgG/HfaB family protein [Candidatus Omnitrophota bacterium]
MRSFKIVNVLLLAVFIFSGCASSKGAKHLVAKTDSTSGTTLLSPYSGPKVKIALADFEIKAVKATGDVGIGLKEMFSAALLNSNRFQIVDPQALNAATKEQAQVEQGLIISVAVAEFEPSASGGSAGVGGGGGVGSGFMGALLGGSPNKAHVALDVRIVNPATSNILFSSRVQGQASDVSGAIMGGFLGSWALSPGLSGYANTPMEKAIRICIIEAVRYISGAVPPRYFKY